jgi:hypothetical protein
MHIKKRTKVLLGVLTAWPIVYTVFFIVTLISFILTGFKEPGTDGMPPMLKVIIALHILTMLVIIGLAVFYIVFIFKTDYVEESKKTFWVVVIFIGNMIAMPIFWYLYIWRMPAKEKTNPEFQE